jgi:antitoxin YefM
MEVSVNTFRANLKKLVDKAIDEHRVIRVNRRKGKDFMVISAEDYEREQETLYVLRNNKLMTQVAESLNTYHADSGFEPDPDQLHEITDI